MNFNHDSCRNMASMLLEAAGDQQIEAVVIGAEEGWDDHVAYQLSRVSDLPPGATVKTNFNHVLTWKEASRLLDYTVDTSFGTYEGHDICAWTRDWILFCYQYDGSQSVVRVPRNPVAHTPITPGG